MAVKRSRVSLVANCGKLYAIGGFDGNTNLASMETYDINKVCIVRTSPWLSGLRASEPTR